MECTLNVEDRDPVLAVTPDGEGPYNFCQLLGHPMCVCWPGCPPATTSHSCLPHSWPSFLLLIPRQSAVCLSWALLAREPRQLVQHVLLWLAATLCPAGLRCQARSEQAWAGGRGTVGAFSGKVYYEATVADEGLCRCGIPYPFSMAWSLL